MAQNDNFLLSRKTEAGLLNMGPDKHARAGSQILKDNLVILAEYKQISPGGTSAAFTSRVKFPRDFFDPGFLPVVICTVGTEQGIKRISHLIKELSAEGFSITIREHTKSTEFKPSQIYFISYMALGVKGG